MFASFIPGENIFVYAQVFNNEALSQVKTKAIQIPAAASLHRWYGTEAWGSAASAIWKIWMSGFGAGIRIQPVHGAVTTSKTVTAVQNSDLTWKAGENTADESSVLRLCGEAAYGIWLRIFESECGNHLDCLPSDGMKRTPQIGRITTAQ